MKPIFRHYSKCLRIAIPALLLSWRGFAQSSQTNRYLGEATHGEGANSIRAEVNVVWPQEQGRLPEVAVFIAELAKSSANPSATQNSSTNEQTGQFAPYRRTNTAWLAPFLQKLMDNDWVYYKPTNIFCGPIELRDSIGRKMRLLKPDVSSPTTYPLSYSLTVARSYNWTQQPVHRGLDNFPPALLTTSSFSQLTRFQLGDYFEIKEPGEYLFTVWPKIYKRSPTNSDICERIDLPPVTATFQWSGQKSK